MGDGGYGGTSGMVGLSSREERTVYVPLPTCNVYSLSSGSQEFYDDVTESHAYRSTRNLSSVGK